MPLDFDQARYAMIEQQVRPWEVLDPRVLEALSTVRREDYVPPRHRKLAFADLALPLEHGEFMMKPIIEGRMLQALDLAPEQDVLEVGTGSGFVTACLAHLAREVVSIDLHADFVERARQRLQGDRLSNTRIEAADAFAFEPGRRFDAVCISGAVAEVPQRFFEWVKPGGRLFVIRGLSPVQEAVRFVNNPGGWQEESLFDTDIPYLQGAAPVERFTL
jgi:protein-L-isoaspartate(D-aspartate) O-methyltransferase